MGDVIAESLAGGDAFLKLVGGTGVVAAEEQTGEVEAVGGAELLLSLVLDGTAEQGCLRPWLIGQLGQFGVEVAVAMTGEQLAVDGDGLLALAHDGIDDGHVSLVVLVARVAAHGLL